jgi:hypothetical protein
MAPGAAAIICANTIIGASGDVAVTGVRPIAIDALKPHVAQLLGVAHHIDGNDATGAAFKCYYVD